MNLTKLDQALDALNTLAKGMDRATRKRRRWKREHFVAAFQAGSTVANAVAMVLPQVRPAAAIASVLSSLQQSLPNTSAFNRPKDERRLFARLEALQLTLANLKDAAPDVRQPLEAQQQLLLELVEDYERNK